jgi:hypothetical protein
VKAWKHILFLVGALGVIGAFLPLIEVQHGKITFAFTARELSFGLERTHSLIERELPKELERRVPISIRDGRDDMRTVTDAARYAMLLFVPSALIVLLGVIGLWRGRVGRAIGGAAILLGLISIASWFALRYGIDYGLEEAALARTRVTLEVGAHLLIVAGLAGVIAGLGALVRPDAGPPPRPRPGPPAPAWQPHAPPPR